MNNDKYAINDKINKFLYDLSKTDYISDKFIPALVRYVLTGDKSLVIALYEQYEDTLDYRQDCRDAVNELKRKLDELGSAE